MNDAPDFSPTAVDVVLRPEWEAVQSNDKDFYGNLLGGVYSDTAWVAYTVAANKDLYITSVQGACVAAAAADADLNQFMAAEIVDLTDAITKFEAAGNGGIVSSFNKPLVIPRGHDVLFKTTIFTNHGCNCSISVQGYEQ